MGKMITVREAIDQLDANTEWKKFQLNYPEAKLGRFSIEKFSIGKIDKHRAEIIAKEGMDRDPGSGTFTRLVETVPGAGENGSNLRKIWMSDTRAEIMEHTPLFNRLWWAELDSGPGIRLLINGLGLGVAVHGALQYKISHIDVVEHNEAIVDLVRPLITDDRVTIHSGDAYDMQWPRGTKWDFAWHDIWPAIDDDNLPGMRKLHAKYRKRVYWQGCWQYQGCLKMASITRRARNGTLGVEEAMDALIGRVILL
jgi:hypothetical protein